MGKQIRSPAGGLALRMEGDGGEDLWALQRQKEKLLSDQRKLDKQKRELSKKVAAPAAVATPVCALSCTHQQPSPQGPGELRRTRGKITGLWNLPVSLWLCVCETLDRSAQGFQHHLRDSGIMHPQAGSI